MIGLIWIGSLYFLPDIDSTRATYDQATLMEINGAYDANFDKIQNNRSELLYEIYYPIKVGNLIWPILISSNGNSVLNLNFDVEEKSIFMVTSSLNTPVSKLLIDIPRAILDSKANGKDKNFTVMADDLPAKFLEITNSSEEEIFSNSIINNVPSIQYSNNTESRILMIEFDSNSKIIKISGTDTNHSGNESQVNRSRTDEILSGVESQSNTFIPIITVAVVSGIGVFYFLHRKNRLRFIRKIKS